MPTHKLNTGKTNGTVNTTTVWDRIVKLEENVPSTLKVDLEGVQSQLAQITTQVGEKLAPEVDDTARIQRAIDSAFAKGGGVVLLSKMYDISSLRLKTKVFLVGNGYGTGLKSIANNTADHLIQLDNDSQFMVGLVNFYIDGNKANQTKPINGVYINNGSTNGTTLPEGDHHNFFDNVYIKNCSGSGFYMGDSSRENRIISVVSRNCDKYGFYIGGTDNVFTNLTVAKSGLHGFYILGNNNKFTNCKAFGCGLNTGDLSDGFLVGYGCTGVQITNCDAQENARHGLSIIQTSGITVENFVSDSNGVSVGYGAGFNLDTAVNCRITGMVINQNQLAGTHKYATQIQNSGSYNNDIRVTVKGTTTKLLKWFYNGAVANCANTVIINGVTANVKNMFPTPDIIIDSNSDGLADNFVAKEAQSGITSTATIDYTEQAQKLTITANTSGVIKQGTNVRYDVPMTPGQILTAKITGKVDNASKMYLTINVNWYNGTTYLSTTGSSKQISSTEWDVAVLTQAVAPATTTSARVNITLVANGTADTGVGFIKDFYVGKLA